jgi:hypothetical protein
MTAAEYRRALAAVPFGKRLPGAVRIADPGGIARIASQLLITRFP